MKRKFEPNLIIINKDSSIDSLVHRMLLIFQSYNAVIIRTMYTSERVGMVHGACKLLAGIGNGGFIKKPETKEIQVTLKSGGQINNLQFDIELIEKFHKFERH